MKTKYYNRVKLTQIILDLIYLLDEMDREGHVDRATLRGLKTTIEELKYYLQFLPKTNTND